MSSGVCLPALVTSTNADVIINSPSAIAIGGQPTVSQTLCLGSGLNLSVSATGTGPLTYQWKKNGTDIGGRTTGSSYSIVSVVSGDAGNYTVFWLAVQEFVYRLAFWSNIASVGVDSPASISVEPTASQTLCVGSSLTLSVSATGTGLSYQWKKNGTAIGLATSSSYSIGSVGVGDAATYTVDVTSEQESGVCLPATVTSTRMPM